MIIPVKTADGGYDIVVEKGALSAVRDLLELDRKVLVVTDDGVPAEYSDTVASMCAEAVKITLPQGEATKCMNSLELLLKAMLDNSFTRSDCVVAVGGGVVGDLSGFAASCYMRGIDFYNIPTTLLSQVDSSIGGKTAIDFMGVKNIVGAFYQPKKVIIDPDTLSTLDDRLLSAGLAEAIKMSLTSDKELFEIIENSTDIRSDLEGIITRSLKIKADVVEQDPKENGLRRILNFGHTIGHAVESCCEPELYHGECVALGMIPMCSAEVRSRLVPVLTKNNLPTVINRSSDELMPYIIHDKKMQSSCVNAVFVDSIGSFNIQKVTPNEIIKRLEDSQ